MKYLVVENGWQYDDNNYYPVEGYTAQTLFSDKKKAEEKAKTLSYEKVFASYGCGEIGPQYFRFTEWVEGDCDLEGFISYLRDKKIPFKDLYSFRLPKGTKKEVVLRILEELQIFFYEVIEVEEE